MSDTSNRLAGTAYVTVDGITVMVAVHGYKETINAPYIVCQIRDSGGISVSDFNDQTHVNIVCELANGKTIIGSAMWSVNTQEVDSTEGTLEVRWEGGSVTEN
ncbi:phage tail tube protein [Yersinia pseudotuberculosis]|uniref:phage tail tube protein n=1 Tax=Yersinia pseudotuberculosis TaxID=633 RepID=UPI00034AC887|nr:phage tail tube protein [Yersinia pseudotuberculosis]